MAKRNKWRTKEAVKIAEEAGLKALRTGGERIITSAMNNVPIESGTLRRSATTTAGGLPDMMQVYEAAKEGNEMKNAFPEPIGKEKAVYVSYNTPYARRQHEEMDYIHPVGGGPKYLENAFNMLKGKIIKMAELQIKKALRNAK
ncbi:MAG TPA: hypothetical protein GX004_08875 [Firmicutes bacterium]|jgi:hypothetical protein|nr:hypothetical protein [Bacillota bacterium]